MINLFILFLLGSLFGIFAYIYIPKLLGRFFLTIKKDFIINFTITHFFHPTELAKRGEYVRVKSMSIKVSANNENDAIDIANDVVHDNLKLEINSIEEITKEINGTE